VPVVAADVRVPLRSERFSVVINWSEAPRVEHPGPGRFSGAVMLAAGGASTLAADRDVIVRAADAQRNRPGDVAITVKAWEPPLHEFIDFVQDLRKGLKPGVAIVVIPIADDGAGAAVGANAPQVEVWRRRVARAGDPWLRVATRAEEDGSS